MEMGICQSDFFQLSVFLAFFVSLTSVKRSCPLGWIQILEEFTVNVKNKEAARADQTPLALGSDCFYIGFYVSSLVVKDSPKKRGTDLSSPKVARFRC